MKTAAAFALCIAASPLAAGLAHAAALPKCSEEQLRQSIPHSREVDAHRLFPLPSLSYSFGTRMVYGRSAWGLQLGIGVDETGAAVCHASTVAFKSISREVRRGRLTIMSRLHEWRYRPFTRNGKAVPVILYEAVREEEQLPTQRARIPKVPPGKARITLRRGLDYGYCPDYRVDIHGDGRVVFFGAEHVDVRGRHHYRVSRKAVARLVKNLRAGDIWSAQPIYRARPDACPLDFLTIDMDGRIRVLNKDDDDRSGIPAAVDALLNDVDRTARSDMWVRLSRETIRHLKKKGFDFTSRAAGDFLARAVANPESRNEDAMLSLILLGAPVDSYAPPENVSLEPRRVLEEALLNKRALLIDALIGKGALMTRGRPDQARIDAAFHAAIASGRLAFVQKIWDRAESRFKPALTFEDSALMPGEADVIQTVVKTVPVTLVLNKTLHDKDPWDGLAIARWFAARGADLKAADAEGRTLLYVAAFKGDAAFVRYLLAQGLDAAAFIEERRRALRTTESEDVALALLETDASLSDADLRNAARTKHWRRVAAWLAASSE